MHNGDEIGSGATVTTEYRPWTPEQGFLLPPSPMQWLPEGHLAYFVLDLVRELDLSAIEDAIQSKDARGVRPYSRYAPRRGSPQPERAGFLGASLIVRSTIRRRRTRGRTPARRAGGGRQAPRDPSRRSPD